MNMKSTDSQPRTDAFPVGKKTAKGQTGGHRLTAYVLAAGAGSLTTAAQAQATPPESIVYTPANINFGSFGTASIPLDLNHDGIPDINVWYANTSFQYGGCGGANGNVDSVPATGNAALTSPLLKGALIGSSDAFKGARNRMAYGFNDGCSGHGSYGYGGPFANVTDEYLGVRFMIHGQQHYGWLRVTVTASVGRVGGTISGYAYNTVPGQKIVAGETTIHPAMIHPATIHPTQKIERAAPAGLGLLSLGVVGLAWWREGKNAWTTGEGAPATANPVDF